MANISDIPASPSTIVTTRSKCQKTLRDTVYTEQWTSNRETAISERCVLHAIPVTSWPSTESDAYDKWSRCTTIKRIGWTLAFLQCVHNWRETYSEKNLWCLQWVQEQVSNQNGQENWQVEGKNVHVQPPVEIKTIWYFLTRQTACAQSRWWHP